jgi:hypothetical protein
MHLSVRTCLFPLVFAPALFAQARLTLADAVSQALTGNPRLSEASARIGVAEGLRKQAGRNEEVNLGTRLLTNGEGTREAQRIGATEACLRHPRRFQCDSHSAWRIRETSVLARTRATSEG